MKKLTIVTILSILITSSSYASGLYDPVVKSPVVSEQGDNKSGGFKKFLLLLLLLGVGLGSGGSSGSDMMGSN